MIWFWIGFFAFVAVLLALDLGVLHRKQTEPTIKSSAYWTAGWMALGLAFTGFVYLMYDNGWLGATLHERGADNTLHAAANPGSGAAMTYVSAYLLEYALSVDNIFVIALLFKSFRVPTKYQHRVLFWGIIGAVFFRVGMLSGGAFLADKFDFLFYIFGAYLAWQGLGLLRGGDDEAEGGHDNNRMVKFLRRYIKIDDAAKHDWKFSFRHNGKLALTTLAICLISIELTDVVFAMDSIPAVLSVSEDVFIMVTSNIFAILGLRTLYFVLAGAMDQFKYLKIALAVLLMIIGAKLALHNHIHIPEAISLALIAGIIGTGVLASVISARREAARENQAS